MSHEIVNNYPTISLERKIEIGEEIIDVLRHDIKRYTELEKQYRHEYESGIWETSEEEYQDYQNINSEMLMVSENQLSNVEGKLELLKEGVK
tara:strand:+ start:1285 stop:1560 length:276 start_codon:yes stop_codon:yes gene_type:complete